MSAAVSVPTESGNSVFGEDAAKLEPSALPRAATAFECPPGVWVGTIHLAFHSYTVTISCSVQINHQNLIVINRVQFVIETDEVIFAPQSETDSI